MTTECRKGRHMLKWHVLAFVDKNSQSRKTKLSGECQATHLTISTRIEGRHVLINIWIPHIFISTTTADEPSASKLQFHCCPAPLSWLCINPGCLQEESSTPRIHALPELASSSHRPALLSGFSPLHLPPPICSWPVQIAPGPVPAPLQDAAQSYKPRDCK